MRSTQRIAYAATDISRIADAVCAVTRMSCGRTEICGATEAVRSVAHTARIAATEGASALVGSLSAHAGLATTNARADKLIGTARLTVSVGQAVIQVGRVLPVLRAKKIEIVPVRREAVGVPRIVGLPRRLPANCSGSLRPDLVRCHGTIRANTVRIIRLPRRIPASCSSSVRPDRGRRRSSVGAAAAGTTCGFDRMVLAVGNLVGITGRDIHMIQVLLVATSVRIDLVRRGTQIGARTGSYLVRVNGLLLRNSLSSCDALTHTVVTHGSSGRAASSTVARRPAVRASGGCAGSGCAVGASCGCAGRGSAMCPCAGRRSTGCAVGGAASAVGGTAGIRIHERVVVSAVRRAGGSVRGSRMPGGASIAGCGRMRRRGGLSRTRHTVGAVARIRGRKSRILDIRTTVRGVAGVACSVCGVAASVSGVAGVACSVCGVAASVSGVAGATGTVCGMARATGEATATRSCMACTARTAGDTATARSGVRRVAGATSSIGGPADCVCRVAGIPEGPTRPRCAAHVTDPVQGASHAVDGMSGVVSVVGCSGQVLCGVRQIHDIRRGIQTAGAQLADHVHAELGQGADVVGVNRQDRLDDLFTDAESTSSAGQGLLAGGHAGAATHRRNREDHVGQEVTDGAPGIVGPRIPVDQRLADSLHKAHGIVPQRLRHGRQRLGGYLFMLDVVLFQGHVAHEYAAEVPHALAAAQLPYQLHDFDNGLEGAAQDRTSRAGHRIPPRALGQLRNTRIQCGNQQVTGLVDLIDQRLEISFCGRHGRAARTLITRGTKHGQNTICCGLAARISLIVLRLLDRVAALLPTDANPITLGLRRRQRRRIRRVGLGRRRERFLGVHPALDLHLELRTEMIRRPALPPISVEGGQTRMDIPELVGASHHHRGARRNTTRIPTDRKNWRTTGNNTHVRSRPRTNDGRLAERLSSRLNSRHVLLSLIHVLAIST